MTDLARIFDALKSFAVHITFRDMFHILHEVRLMTRSISETRFQNDPRRRECSFQPSLNTWIEKSWSGRPCCSVTKRVLTYTYDLAGDFTGFSLLSGLLRPIKYFSLPRFYSLQDANLNSSSNIAVPGARTWLITLGLESTPSVKIALSE